MRFPMTLDRAQRLTTGFALAMLPLVLLATQLGRPAPPGLVVTLLVIVGGILLVAWARAPLAVEVTPDELRVHRRRAKPLVLRATDVVRCDDGPARPHLRLFGAAGYFGLWGLFWTARFGRYWLYAARSSPTIALHRKRGVPVVLAVDDLPGLRAALADWVRDE
jgi:hypothetical protein